MLPIRGKRKQVWGFGYQGVGVFGGVSVTPYNAQANTLAPWPRQDLQRWRPHLHKRTRRRPRALNLALAAVAG